MLFVALLLAGYVLATLVRSAARRDRWRLALAAAMAAAGMAHLLTPLPFVQHLPPWVPSREALVAASGVVEIALGAALLSHRRESAGALLAAYLVAVWPANIYVAVAGVDVQGQPDGVYPWLRLPLQALFIWLAWWSTRHPATAEPGRQSAERVDRAQAREAAEVPVDRP